MISERDVANDGHSSGPLPCLGLSGAKIFAPTADQRFLIGADEFFRTHFPVKLQKHMAGDTQILNDEEILYRLLNPGPDIVGNRVFVLYGAAGSGKSELMRWLHTSIELRDAARASVATRISRMDLDVFRLAQRLQHLYDVQPFEPASMQRWEECRQKPRTLAKILVLTALEQMLCSDEEINAIYYQLIDVVQTNLEQCFVAMSQPREDIGQFIELFHREDLENLLRESVIPITLEYEALRYHLLKAFRDQLLEGLDFADMLKKISLKIIRERGQRPILFIDDLVQSINLFATDLLDYFITLEEGCWDVVIGVTPNSLDATRRGKELLDRITFLDTIDDRVEKFWLSDEYGTSSSFLDESNCVEYARLYLSEYKRQNKQPCNMTCPSFQRCFHLEPDQSDNLLAPFNKEVLVRLFRSLPEGKGRVRYFTAYLREILNRVTSGEDLLQVVQRYVKAEHGVYHSDKYFAQMYEFYGPLLDQAERSNNTHLHRFFEIPASQEYELQPVVVSLNKNLDLHPGGTHEVKESAAGIDLGKEAIKTWLQGEAVNKQQLRNLRRGIVKAVKDGFMLDTLTRLHSAKPSRVLRWGQTRLETVPPVRLEGIDEYEGLNITRGIGTLAYILHDFADASGWVEQDLRAQLLNHGAFPLVLFEGIAYREHILANLEKMIGVKIEELIFALFAIARLLGADPINLPVIIEQEIGSDFQLPLRYVGSIEAERPKLENRHISMIRRLFDDCFKLRENVYDGMLLESVAASVTPAYALRLIQTIDTDALSPDFRLNDDVFRDLIHEVQIEIYKLENLRTNSKVASILLSVCGTDSDVGEASKKLVALFGKRISRITQTAIYKFLKKATLVELHQALILACVIDDIKYEQSLVTLRNVLAELEPLPQVSGEVEGQHSESKFSEADIDMLMQFTQQGFQLSISQLDAGFLQKVDRFLPYFYERLEVRFQRG